MFLVFGGVIYYAGGGADDFIAAFDTFEAAMKSIDTKKYEWQHIFCTKTHKIYDFQEGEWRDPQRGESE